MTAEEMKQEFNTLYNLMAGQQNVEYMRTFGNVHKEMMDWFIANKPELAQEWIDKLASIRWRNYLTLKEASRIVEKMQPQAPWSRDQWRAAMEQHQLPLDKEPEYNSNALWVAMNMEMSDSSNTLAKYIDKDRLFAAVYDLAVDKLTDKDRVFNIREYFKV